MIRLRPRDHLLFIGDSITHAHRRPEEVHDCYRLGCGYVNMIAAHLGAAQPELRLRFTNRGECGHTLRDLAERWQRDCLDLRPDVLTILIGINDAASAEASDPDTFIRGYGQLLSGVRASLPDAQVLLMGPFGLSVPPPPLPAQAAQPDRVSRVKVVAESVQATAAEYDAAFVGLQSLFDAASRLASTDHWTLDGVHPSAAGHMLIARAWLQKVRGASGNRCGTRTLRCGLATGRRLDLA